MKRIAHVDLVVSNADRALEFYVGVLGCKVVEDGIVTIPSLSILTRGVSDQVRIILMQLPGAGASQPTIELMEFQGGSVPSRFGSSDGPLPSLWSFSLVVYDLEATIAELAAKGIATVTPIDVVKLPRAGTCRIAFIRDPDNNLIELIDVPKRAASPPASGPAEGA